MSADALYVSKSFGFSMRKRLFVYGVVMAKYSNHFRASEGFKKMTDLIKEIRLNANYLMFLPNGSVFIID